MCSVPCLPVVVGAFVTRCIVLWRRCHSPLVCSNRILCRCPGPGVRTCWRPVGVDPTLIWRRGYGVCVGWFRQCSRWCLGASPLYVRWSVGRVIVRGWQRRCLCVSSGRIRRVCSRGSYGGTWYGCSGGSSWVCWRGRFRHASFGAYSLGEVSRYMSRGGPRQLWRWLDRGCVTSACAGVRLSRRHWTHLSGYQLPCACGLSFHVARVAQSDRFWPFLIIRSDVWFVARRINRHKLCVFVDIVLWFEVIRLCGSNASWILKFYVAKRTIPISRFLAP